MTTLMIDDLTPPFKIPYSQVKGFVPPHTQRYGQAIYDHLLLNKLQDNLSKMWADRLYEADDVTARNMVAYATDYQN